MGHISIGWDDFTQEQQVDMIKAMDATVGLESVLLDSDTERKKLYGKAAAGILKNAANDNRNSIENRIKRIEKIRDNCDKIIALAKTAKTTAFVEDIMKRAGAPLRPQDVGVDEKIVHNSMLIAKEVRQRYTILNMLSDLGLTEKYTAIIDEFIK